MSAKSNAKNSNGTGKSPAPLLRFIIVITAIFAFAVLLPVFPSLNIEGGGERMCLPLSDGGQFGIKYTHSVNRSPVIDTIERTGGTLTVRTSLFQTYGAGIPVLGDEVGNVYTETEDGFLLSGIDAEHEKIDLITGTYADHHLIYGDEEFQLKKTFGEKTLITFTAERTSLLRLFIYRP